MTFEFYSLVCFLQFRLAYVSPESMVVGAGDLVDQPKKIALNYLRSYLFIDLFVVFPLPQVNFLPSPFLICGNFFFILFPCLSLLIVTCYFGYLVLCATKRKVYYEV